MNTLNSTRQQLIDRIKNLPSDVLPELANYLNYLQFKAETPEQAKLSKSGTQFLLAIAGLGEGAEDLSERDEEILAEEINPLRGWGFDRRGNDDSTT